MYCVFLVMGKQVLRTGRYHRATHPFSRFSCDDSGKNVNKTVCGCLALLPRVELRHDILAWCSHIVIRCPGYQVLSPVRTQGPSSIRNARVMRLTALRTGSWKSDILESSSRFPVETACHVGIPLAPSLRRSRAKVENFQRHGPCSLSCVGGIHDESQSYLPRVSTHQLQSSVRRKGTARIRPPKVSWQEREKESCSSPE